MKSMYRKFRKGKGKVWYCQNNETGKQESLKTKDLAEANRLLDIKNHPYRFAAFNLQMARTHLQMSNPEINNRTWQQVMDALARTKMGRTKIRYERAAKDKALDAIRNAVLIETAPEALFDVMAKGTVCTNVYLRRWHNFAVDMNWLLLPLIPKNRWPAVKHEEKRAITLDEHTRIVERERNPERRAFYEVCWHIGASQSDVANLNVDNIDWKNRTLNFIRQKTKEPVHMSIGPELERLLRALPQSGLLFPYADRILAAKSKDSDADVSKLERELDELVYALYGLTPEEIKTVEGAAK